MISRGPYWSIWFTHLRSTTNNKTIKAYTHGGWSFIAFLLPFKNLPEVNNQSEYKHTKTFLEKVKTDTTFKPWNLHCVIEKKMMIQPIHKYLLGSSDRVLFFGLKLTAPLQKRKTNMPLVNPSEEIKGILFTLEQAPLIAVSISITLIIDEKWILR